MRGCVSAAAILHSNSRGDEVRGRESEEASDGKCNVLDEVRRTRRRRRLMTASLSKKQRQFMGCASFS